MFSDAEVKKILQTTAREYKIQSAELEKLQDFTYKAYTMDRSLRKKYNIKTI